MSYQTTFPPIESGQNPDRIIALASLFEGEFMIDWLIELSRSRASIVIAELQALIDKEMLVSPRPGVYVFKDKASQTEFRKDVRPDERETLHRKIADILIQEFPETDEKLKTVSQHLLQVNNDLTYCRFLLKAGDAFRSSFQNEQALQCYSKILKDLKNSHDPESDRLFSETAIQYAKTSTAQHETAKVLATLTEALTRASKQGHLSAQSLLEMHIASNEWLRAHYDQAIVHFERGWQIAEGLEDQQFRRAIDPFSTFFLYWQGKFREAVLNHERTSPSISDYPNLHFPLLCLMMVGYCYAQIGQITQGLGIIDAIGDHCLKRGDRYLASNALATLGEIMLTMRRIDEAMTYIQDAIKLAKETNNRWVWLVSQITMAFAHQCKGEHKQALTYLNRFLKNSREVDAIAPYPYVLELLHAMEIGEMPRAGGLSMEQEVEKSIQAQNIYLKGIAYRHHAFLLSRKDAPRQQVMASFRDSIRWLSLSGHVIESIRSRVEFARYFVAQGEDAKAGVLTRRAYKDLSLLNTDLNLDLIPHELRQLAPPPAKDKEVLLKKMLELGRDIVHVRDNRELMQMMQHIITVINQLTGAERGAIFLIEENETNAADLQLRASKNLTAAEVAHPDFSTSLDLIKEAIKSRQGLIRSPQTGENEPRSPSQRIRSMICVPMVFRDKIIGVLYHDNRLLSSAFKEEDLEILSYVVALAAIALDNANAYEEIHALNQKLQEEKKYYEEEHSAQLHFDNIVGNSRAMQKVITQITQVAETDATVLIQGETGVGKELVARAIHRLSQRRDKPFISVQLSALTGNLIPSELFGHEKGAFTGATQRRIGRFELADGGTLFLDEIGDIPEEIQIQLLRVLQTRQFERVGGSTHLTSNFRLITATNRPLAQEVREGNFREDLYYRLSAFPIQVPALRDRREDVPLLAHHFLNIHAKKQGKEIKIIPKQEMDKLIQYHWPGNVRELENIIERSIILSRGQSFRITDIDAQDSDNGSEGDCTLAENERKHILRTLIKTNWKISGPKGAAKLLGVPPSTLSFRMRKLGVHRN